MKDFAFDKDGCTAARDISVTRTGFKGTHRPNSEQHGVPLPFNAPPSLPQIVTEKVAMDVLSNKGGTGKKLNMKSKSC